MAEANLSRFIRENQTEILEQWKKAVCQLPPARLLPEPALIDHLPRLLERVAALADEFATTPGNVFQDASDQHALSRLAEGYDLADVVTEYTVLRDVIFDLSERPTSPLASELRLLNRVIDDATREAVARFSQASRRILEGLNRISSERFGTQGLQGLLDRLLRVLMESSPSVDEVTLLLVEGDRLVVRAAAGLTAERPRPFSLAIGEGFAGTVAARREPLLLRCAHSDPLISSQFIRDRQVCAIYGIPLEHEGDLVGVAHIGSRTAYDFSEEDTLLFRALANRATAVIIEAQLHERELAARDQMRATAERLRLALDAGSLGTWDWDLESGAMRWDERCSAILRQDPQESPSYDTFMTLIHPDDRPRVTEAVRAALDPEGRGEYAVEYRTDPGRGSERWVAERGRAHFQAGRPTRFVGTIIDITERKANERDLAETARLRELFIGVLGHDLRNPLHAIHLTANTLLRRGELRAGETRAISRIALAADRMSRLIRDVVDFTRGRFGRGIPFTPAAANLAEICRAAVDELEVAHPDADVQLEIRGESTGHWDGDRLSQVVSNLVSNAIEHGTGPVTVKVDGRSEEVLLTVHNSGTPIPAEVLPHLFDPFLRLQTRDRAADGSEGLGLGLYIVHELVTAHGGGIEVSSSALEGTTFSVHLPRG